MIHGFVAAGLGALMTVMAATPGDVVEARTASSTTVRHTDGTHAVTLYSGPVRMQRSIGGGSIGGGSTGGGSTGWVPVDLTLVARPDGTVRPVASPQDLVLTPTGPTVRYASGGAAALDWATPLPAPRLAGATATYPQARPGYDLVVDATAAGFVASLRKATAASVGAPVTPLRLRGTAEGSLTEGASDSAVSRVVAAAPSTGTTPVPFDTTVATTVLRSDTSGEPDLRVGSYDGKAVARSYLTFDVAALTARPVTKAVLAVHQEWSASCTARSWEVWSAPAAGPATRWTNQPAADRRWATSTDTRGHDPACAAGWSSVDVTDLVRGWAASGARTGTIQLRATNEADPLSWKRFGSAESTAVPHLTVTTP